MTIGIERRTLARWSGRAICLLVVLSAVEAALSAPGHSCSGCHDRHGPSASPVDAAAKPGAEACLRCHSDLLRGDASRGTRPIPRTRSIAYGHLKNGGLAYDAAPPESAGRAFRLDCTTCHAPHPNGRRCQLRVPDQRSAATIDADEATSLCVTCHTDKAPSRSSGGLYSRHPLGVPSQDAVRARSAGLPLFDVRGTDDPSDDVIGCLTCHFAHAGPDPNLLRWRPRDVREACGACHRDIYDPAVLDDVRVAALH